MTVDLETGADRAAGRIVLSGPVVARGYRGRPDDPAFARPGCSVTGDARTLVGRPLCRCSAGLDDVIVTGGLKVAPQRWRRRSPRWPGVADVVVVGVPDEQWGEVVTAVVVPAADGLRPRPRSGCQAVDRPHQRPRRLDPGRDACPELVPASPIAARSGTA